jgi:putative addiction module killer protein
VEARPRELRNYVDANDDEPFQDWLDGLDSRMRNIIQARLIRVRNGNFGDCHGVGEGVSEFRIDVGPGYRVYFGQDGDQIILLTGGTKKTQAKDIDKAKDYWRDYNA